MNRFKPGERLDTRRDAYERALERRARVVRSPGAIKWLAGLSLAWQEKRLESAGKRFDKISARQAQSAIERPEVGSQDVDPDAQLAALYLHAATITGSQLFTPPPAELSTYRPAALPQSPPTPE